MKKKFFNKSLLIIFIILIISANSIFCIEKLLKIHFIDVDEGDAIFIESPDSKNILIDTGNPISGIRVVDYLKKLKIKKIDNLILTHPHLDHIGGVFSVAQLFKVKSFFDNGEDISKNIKKFDFYRWYNDFYRMDKRYKQLQTGDIFTSGKLSLNILWPDKIEYKDWNANSIVILIKYGKFKCLLMGDGNKHTEQELIKKNIDINATVLKAGHHGANDTASIEFLQKVKPEVVIITINANNIRDYPSAQVIKRYENIGAKIYKTYKHGDITVIINKNGKYSIKYRRNIRKSRLNSH
ncbi:MAG: MBL fold metallo-hydrolase [Spirochaetes bacterium]|nr:MBL fold metallo-hydrolase [Spirochaetota bacterium]